MPNERSARRPGEVGQRQLRQRRIAQALQPSVAPGAYTSRLLQSLGLVTRTQDPADRRRNLIALTPAGQLVDLLRPVAQESQRGFLQTLAPAEREILISLLRRALDANDAALGTATDDVTPPPHTYDSPTRGE